MSSARSSKLSCGRLRLALHLTIKISPRISLPPLHHLLLNRCAASAKKVKSELESRLLSYAGKPVEVAVRTAFEMAAVVKANPFPKAASRHTVAIFLDEAPPPDALAHAVGGRGEEMCLGVREIYVHYGTGMGTSKLRIPAGKTGTARNINTITKLADRVVMISMLGQRGISQWSWS